MRAKKKTMWECPYGEMSETEPSKVEGFYCEECDTIHVDEPEKKLGFMCGECEEFYEDRDDAKECCKE